MQIGWARGIRDACTDANAFFFKQWGGRTPKSLGRELDGRLGTEMPTPLHRVGDIPHWLDRRE
jgi:protein gp37